MKNKRKETIFNFAITNARSILQKTQLNSTELELSLMIVTETWMNGGPAQEKVEDILENDAGINVIKKNWRG